MKSLVLALVILFSSVPLIAEQPAAWTEPIEPFRIVGNVYYVGTADLSSFLIATPAGHILIDAPLEENVPRLLRSIRSLGFDPREVEIMINSHAHFDHAGGFAEMKAATGAKLFVSRADAALIGRGGRDDFAFGDRGAFTPAEVDRYVEDGDVIELGGTRIQALSTPGHTMGDTSWLMEVQDAGRTVLVLFANSMSAPGYDLLHNEKYPTIMNDYRSSFDRLEGVDADVFLSTHGTFFRLEQKIAEMKNGGANPFIDPDESKRFVARWRGVIEGQYEDQKVIEAVGEVLDRFHRAASEADGETYFSLLESEAVFIGTDAEERWTVEEFRAFAEPYFDRGQGWTYVPTERHVDLDEDRSTAWFDEMLENESYGTTRGTGVLLRTRDGWRIVQYHLTIPIPNEIAKDVVEMIRGTMNDER